MFDIFSKSKVGQADKYGYCPKRDRAGGMDDAWRISHAIDRALRTAESEKNDLADRIENATAWAAVSLGNGNDEYLERETLDTQHLNLFDNEIRLGTKRTSRLDQDIACYRLLKAALISRFPQLNKDGVRSEG